MLTQETLYSTFFQYRWTLSHLSLSVFRLNVLALHFISLFCLQNYSIAAFFHYSPSNLMSFLPYMFQLSFVRKVAKRKSNIALYADELGKGFVGELDYNIEAANATKFLVLCSCLLPILY